MDNRGDFISVPSGTPSMTTEEMNQQQMERQKTFEQDFRDTRRQMIVNSLIARGIDPETVDLEQTMANNEIVFKTDGDGLEVPSPRSR